MTASAVRHISGVALQALLLFAIVAILALALSPVYAPAGTIAGTDTAQAGKASVTITFANSLRATSSWPSAGSAVSFSVSPGGVKDRDLHSLWVANKCSQNGTVVYAAYMPVKDNLAGPFGLAWAGSGSASCTAYVWLFPASETPIRGATMSYSAGS